MIACPGSYLSKALEAPLFFQLNVASVRDLRVPLGSASASKQVFPAQFRWLRPFTVCTTAQGRVKNFGLNSNQHTLPVRVQRGQREGEKLRLELKPTHPPCPSSARATGGSSVSEGRDYNAITFVVEIFCCGNFFVLLRRSAWKNPLLA